MIGAVDARGAGCVGAAGGTVSAGFAPVGRVDEAGAACGPEPCRASGGYAPVVRSVGIAPLARCGAVCGAAEGRATGIGPLRRVLGCAPELTTGRDS
ncbi:MAG TPA: hypothetical protein VM513_29190 [Kofleriaceae bacterium]|nr:hypothetical protein [Kofleriaceae bacterium]